MAYSSLSETCSFPQTSTVVPSAARRQLWATALRAHRQVSGAEPAASGWRPSTSLLEVLGRLLVPADPFSYPAPEQYPGHLRGIAEPDEPGWGNQLKQVEEDFVELSAAQRELVIEFMKLLREQSRLSSAPRDEG